MFRGQHDCSRAKDRIDARREDANPLVKILNGEINVSAFTAPDPITLALQDLLGPAGFDLFDMLDQLFRVIGDAQKPLLDLFLDHRCAASPTDPS